MRDLDKPEKNSRISPRGSWSLKGGALRPKDGTPPFEYLGRERRERWGKRGLPFVYSSERLRSGVSIVGREKKRSLDSERGSFAAERGGSG